MGLKKTPPIKYCTHCKTNAAHKTEKSKRCLVCVDKKRKEHEQAWCQAKVRAGSIVFVCTRCEEEMVAENFLEPIQTKILTVDKRGRIPSTCDRLAKSLLDFNLPHKICKEPVVTRVDKNGRKWAT